MRHQPRSSQRGTLRNLLGKDIPTTPGEEEVEVVSETVPSPVWHVWEYLAETNRTWYVGTDTRKRSDADNIFYLTTEQHDALLAGNDVDIELAKDK